MIARFSCAYVLVLMQFKLDQDPDGDVPLPEMSSGPWTLAQKRIEDERRENDLE
jgi:hypothetical protein